MPPGRVIRDNLELAEEKTALPQPGPQFFAQLLAATDNRFLPDMLASLHCKLRLALGSTFDALDIVPSPELQPLLCQAIRDGRSDLAARLMRQHGEYRRRALLADYSRNDEALPPASIDTLWAPLPASNVNQAGILGLET